jgi:hypothetical protein
MPRTRLIDSAPILKKPLRVEDIDPMKLGRYNGNYIAGGHGAMEDMPRSWELGRLPSATANRPSSRYATTVGVDRSRGFRMTAFSHAEELVTDMAGRLPLFSSSSSSVLERSTRRLTRSGALMSWRTGTSSPGRTLTPPRPSPRPSFERCHRSTLATSLNREWWFTQMMPMVKKLTT